MPADCRARARARRWCLKLVPSRAESLVGSSCEEFQASETGRQSLRKRTDYRSLRVLQPWANCRPRLTCEQRKLGERLATWRRRVFGGISELAHRTRVLLGI